MNCGENDDEVSHNFIDNVSNNDSKDDCEDGDGFLVHFLHL